MNSLYLNSWEASGRQRTGLALCLGVVILLPLLQQTPNHSLSAANASPQLPLALALTRFTPVQAEEPHTEPAPPEKTAEVQPIQPEVTGREPTQELIQKPNVEPAKPEPAQATQEPPDESIADAAPEQAVSQASAQAEAQQGPNELPLMNEPLFAEPPLPPRYPMQARRRGQTGTVWLAVTLDSRGSPSELDLLASSGVDSLDQAAISAVREWRFQPYRLNGQALASRVHIPVEFSLN